MGICKDKLTSAQIMYRLKKQLSDFFFSSIEYSVILSHVYFGVKG